MHKTKPIARSLLVLVLMLVGGVFAWIAVVVIASAVAGSRVPVSLPYKGNVYSDGIVASASGTWQIDGENSAEPLQTTKLLCSKLTMTCSAATARVTRDGTLYADLEEHEVKHWSDTQVVFVDTSPLCVSYIYTLDLVTKSGRGVRRKSDGGDRSACGFLEKELNLTLVDGGRISDKLRDDALPWFGKVALAPLKLLR